MVELDSEVARAAIKRDLSCYADQWRHLQEVEVEAAYGPVYPQPADIHALQSLREPRQARIWDDSFYPSYKLSRSFWFPLIILVLGSLSNTATVSRYEGL